MREKNVDEIDGRMKKLRIDIFIALLKSLWFKFSSKI